MVEEMNVSTVSCRTGFMCHNSCVHRTLSLGTQGRLHREADICQLEKEKQKLFFSVYVVRNQCSQTAVRSIALIGLQISNNRMPILTLKTCQFPFVSDYSD